MRSANLASNQQSSEAATISTLSSSGSVEQGVLAQDLMTELMGVVPVLGGKKVTVGFAGDGAFCDSTLSYVNIPALPPAKVIPIGIAREIRGFAAHEAAHLAWTDPDIFPSKIIDANGNYDPLLKEVWNVIEDYMIERNWLELYPGARKNFAATEVRCCRSYQELYAKDPDVAKDLRRVGPVALTWLRAIHFGLGTNVSRECFETLPQGLRSRVLGWFNDILDVETTEECLEAARVIHADINAAPFCPQNPPANPLSQQTGQGSQAGQGQAGNQQGQGGQGGGGQPGQGGGGQGGSGPGAGAGTPQAQGGQNGQGPMPIPTGSQLADTLKEEDLVDQHNDMITAQILSDSAAGPAAEYLAEPEGNQRAEEVRKEISGVIGAVSSQLRKSLKTMSRDRWKGGRLDGMIDHTRIASAATGGLENYKRKVRGQSIDTAVSILVDCSSSMSSGELYICQQLAIALESALAPTKVKHEIIGFTTGDHALVDPSLQMIVEANQKQGKTIYLRPVSIYEFRKFGQSHGAAMKSIGNMTEIPLGGTPTDQAILLAHDRLARRQEQRQVLFVLTDGEPDCRKSCKNTVKMVETCGVTVIGIGIGTDAVKHCFSDYTVIQQATDLPAVMLNKLSAILLGDRHLTVRANKGGRRMLRG